jgi:hypothetical protein
VRQGVSLGIALFFCVRGEGDMLCKSECDGEHMGAFTRNAQPYCDQQHVHSADLLRCCGLR